MVLKFIGDSVREKLFTPTILKYHINLPLDELNSDSNFILKWSVILQTVIDIIDFKYPDLTNIFIFLFTIY